MKNPITPALLAQLLKHDPDERLPRGYNLPAGCTRRDRGCKDGTVTTTIFARLEGKLSPMGETGKKRRPSWRRPWTYGGLAEIADKVLGTSEIMKVAVAEAKRRKSKLFVPTVRQAIRDYLDDPDVKAMRSRRARKLHMRRIEQALGPHMLVSAITGEDLQALIMSELARGLAAESLVRQKAAISSFLTWLVGAKKLTEAERLQIMAEIRVPKSAKRDKRQRATITDEEFWTLIACAAVPLRDRAKYVAAYHFGGRSSDLHAWRWQHIDTETWTACVIIRPKTDTGPVRHNLKPEAASILREYYMASGRPAPEKPVFGRAKQGKTKEAVPGSPMSDSSSAAKRLRRHLTVAGIDRHELHNDVEPTDESKGSRRADFHSFRRLLATGLARAKVGAKDAMAIMGWTTPAMYARYQLEQEVQDVPDAALPKRPSGNQSGNH